MGGQWNLSATSCGIPPPCATVGPGSVVFTGTVREVAPASGKDGDWRDVRVSVEEIFEGFQRGTREVLVAGQGEWKTGEHDLFDTSRGTDGRLYPKMCGNTGEISSPYLADVLAFLRLRAQGKTVTSLKIDVTDNFKPLEGARVTVGNSQVSLTGTSDADGHAMFLPIVPGIYSVSAAKEHYHPDKEMPSEPAVEVVAGTCRWSNVQVQADTTVAGLVRNFQGDPVASLKLDLVAMPKHPDDKLTPFGLPFEAITNTEGRFSFDAVSPGRYLLGSSIMGINDSPISPTFYPGSHERLAAFPIDVKLGEATDNLVFNLPDIGPMRDIELCVVDEAGKPVPSAWIAQSPTPVAENRARLGEKLTTDQHGCMKTQGYAQVTYAVRAVLTGAGATLIETVRNTRYSDDIVVPPGKDPFSKVLVLKTSR